MIYLQNNDFKKFANDQGISSNTLNSYESHIENSQTPYILETREMRSTQIDIFSRLMMDRILWLAGVVDDRMSTIVQAQLLYLDTTSDSDITMHIDSPGGSVKSGLSMIDVMQYIKSDIITVNTGLCASMGSVLLAGGTKGKRSSLRFSRTMLHRSSGGAGGHILDATIAFAEWQKVDKILFDLLGEFCGKSPEQIKSDATRDLWLDANEALEYGVIDEILKSKK